MSMLQFRLPILSCPFSCILAKNEIDIDCNFRITSKENWNRWTTDHTRCIVFFTVLNHLQLILGSVLPLYHKLQYSDNNIITGYRYAKSLWRNLSYFIEYMYSLSFVIYYIVHYCNLEITLRCCEVRRKLIENPVWTRTCASLVCVCLDIHVWLPFSCPYPIAGGVGRVGVVKIFSCSSFRRFFCLGFKVYVVIKKYLTQMFTLLGRYVAYINHHSAVIYPSVILSNRLTCLSRQKLYIGHGGFEITWHTFLPHWKKVLRTRTTTWPLLLMD